MTTTLTRDPELPEVTQEEMNAPCPIPEGTRIRLLAGKEGYADLAGPGAEGTAFGGDGALVWVHWDDPQQAGLSPVVYLRWIEYEVIS